MQIISTNVTEQNVYEKIVVDKELPYNYRLIINQFFRDLEANKVYKTSARMYTNKVWPGSKFVQYYEYFLGNTINPYDNNLTLFKYTDIKEFNYEWV